MFKYFFIGKNVEKSMQVAPHRNLPTTFLNKIKTTTPKNAAPGNETIETIGTGTAPPINQFCAILNLDKTLLAL